MITLITIVILLSVVLAGIIYGFLSRLGKRGLLNDYEATYESLKRIIENCPVSLINKVRIEMGFNELTRYSCRNDEKIDILYRQYKRKFDEIMKNENVINHFYRQGKKLKTAYNLLSSKYNLGNLTNCRGLDAHSIIFFNDNDEDKSLLLKSIFQQELIKQVILSLGMHNLSFTHSDEDIEKTIDAYERALSLIEKALASGDLSQFLEGKPITPIFKRW